MVHENIKFDDFKIICRTCLKVSENGMDLFSTLDKLVGKSVIAAALMECFPVQVLVEDKLPKLICQECIQLLDIAFRFRWLCMQSDATLRQILSQYENNIKQEKINFNYEDSIDTSDSTYPSNFLGTNITKETKLCDNNAKTADKKILTNPSSNLVDTIAISPDNSTYSVDSLKCLKCLRAFKRKSNFKKHQQSCSAQLKREKKISKLKYEYNLTTAKDVRLLKTPYAEAKDNIEESGDGRYTCRVCMKTFKDKYHAARHAVIHTDLRYYCPQCDKKFAQTDTLRRHIKNIHTDEEPYLCNWCEKKCKQLKQLQLHIQKLHLNSVENMSRQQRTYKRRRRVSEIVSRPFSCNVCEHRFTTKSSLYLHRKRHGAEKTFLCSECGKGFVSQVGLESHSTVHLNLKPFECNHCGKRFARITALNVHNLKHTGEKPYSCHICNKKFTQSAHLKTHLLLHQGIKPYSCTFCQKSFSQKGNLITHTRTHTGETPFVCSICQKGFYDSSSLRKHERGHKTV